MPPGKHVKKAPMFRNGGAACNTAHILMFGKFRK